MNITLSNNGLPKGIYAGKERSMAVALKSERSITGSKRVASIRVRGDGFILRTRSGLWHYATTRLLFIALDDYIKLIQREIDNEKK